MKIKGSDFSVTGQDNDRHTVGTVSIEFSNGQEATFDDVRQDEFENWVESAYDPDLVPADTQAAWQPWADQVERKSQRSSDEEDDDEDQENEEEDQDDEEEQEVAQIHPLDFIGQATGSPAQGFDPPPPVIADDDLMGLITGFPTPGWG